MPFRRINKDPSKETTCRSRDHDPPMYYHFPEDGTYEWECPECGHKQIVVINRATFYGWGMNENKEK